MPVHEDPLLGDSLPADFTWYHVVLTMYGAWLPGDARGFRTPRGRVAVTGDYKHPPPAGKYDSLSAPSLALPTQAAGLLPPPLRTVRGEAIR